MGKSGDNIQEEIDVAFAYMLPRLSKTHITVMLADEDFTSDISESKEVENASYLNFVTGNIDAGEVANIFWSSLKIFKRDQVKSMFKVAYDPDNNEARKITFHEELAGGEQGKLQRIDQIILYMYKYIYQKASPVQREVLIEDCKNLDYVGTFPLQENKDYDRVVMMKSEVKAPKVKQQGTLYITKIKYDTTGHTLNKDNVRLGWEQLKKLNDNGFDFDKDKDVIINDPAQVNEIIIICGLAKKKKIYEEYSSYMMENKSIEIDDKLSMNIMRC